MDGNLLVLAAFHSLFLETSSTSVFQFGLMFLEFSHLV